MYALGNEVLGTLQADINGAAVSLIVQPLPGTMFNMPPAPTDGGGALTYGEPYGIVSLTDRLDSSAAKVEHALYTGRAAAGGGAYTLSGLVRGWDGSAAQAWVANGPTYILQKATKHVLAFHMQRAVLRSLGMLTHVRDSLMTWNGTSFKFDLFRVLGAGRGKHFTTTGLYNISMPPNATTVKGYGGAADQAVAGGAIPIPAHHALWYEPYIGGGTGSIDANFRVTTYTGDFEVPAHWIFIAMHQESAVAGEAVLRVGNGATLHPWRDIGAAGNPAFANGWVNFGAPYANAGFRKDDAGLVYLRGAIKTGTVNLSMFVLPAGYRPSAEQRYAISSNAAYAELSIAADGTLKMPAGGSNTSAHLNVPPFQAEL